MKLRTLHNKNVIIHLRSKFTSINLVLRHQDLEISMLNHRTVCEVLSKLTSYYFILEQFFDIVKDEE